VLLLCGSVMEEHNNTDISDKRIPISDEQQTIYDKRKRRAEYYRQYRARKKALLVTSISDEQQQTIKDKLRRKAEYNRQYRARKKALLATSSANYANTTCDSSQPSRQTMEDTQTINDKRQRKAYYQRQYRARKKTLLGASSENNDNMACDFAQRSTSTGIEHPVAAVSAVNSITDVTPQNDASNNGKIKVDKQVQSTTVLLKL